MAGRKTTRSVAPPERLLVYEFCGNHPPCGEPHGDGFLGIWPEHPYYYLFFEREPGNELSHWLDKQAGWVLRDRYSLAYAEWQQLSAERFSVGPLIIEVLPGAAPQHPAGRDDGILIRIDPGLVFGSGLHGSTKGCLLALADLFDRYPVKKVVDMGTGTGILAVSCGALGAAKVLAVDRNPLAMRVAARNIFLNGLQDRVDLLIANDLGAVKTPSNLLVMNLELAILQQLLTGSDWLGYPWLILSGFLEKQWDKLREQIPPAFHIRRRETIDDWLTVTIARSVSE